jgi:hypothetical protein
MWESPLPSNLSGPLSFNEDNSDNGELAADNQASVNVVDRLWFWL